MNLKEKSVKLYDKIFGLVSEFKHKESVEAIEDFTTQILSSELEKLQQENKRLRDELIGTNKPLEELQNYSTELETELQQTKAQLEELKFWLSNTDLLSNQTKTIIETYFLT